MMLSTVVGTTVQRGVVEVHRGVWGVVGGLLIQSQKAPKCPEIASKPNRSGLLIHGGD